MRQTLKGSVNVSVDVYIIDSTDGTPELGVLFNTAGMDLEYRREGAAVVDITEVTLALLTTAHTDGGFLEIGHGVYRLDVPDAAFATGASTVSIQGTVTGMIVLPQTIQLVNFDPEDGTRLGLTALPNAAADAAGGLPISDAGGLDLDTKLANTNEVTVARMGALTDWIDGGRLDLLLDAIKAVTDLLPDAGALSDLATILADTDNIQTRLPAALVGGRMDADIGAKTGNVALSPQEKLDVNTEADTALTDYDALVIADLGTPAGADILADIAALKAETVLIVGDTNELQTDWVNGGRLDLLIDSIITNIAALNDISAADVLAQVNAAIDTAIPELAQAIPTATPTLRTGLMLPYMALRDKLDLVAGFKEIHNDAGTQIATKALTDDGTTYSEAKMVAGT